jgi:hypothetical protein
MKNAIIIFLAVAVVGLGITGATSAFRLPNDTWNDVRGRGDAPVRRVNTGARDVYAMPDRFSNVAMTCDEYGNAIYVTTKSDYSRGLFALKDGCE